MARCEIPDWFPAVLTDAQQALCEAETRLTRQSARRTETTRAAATANAVLLEIAAATAPDRDALVQAEARAAEARQRHAAAEHRLSSAPRRRRRGLRHDLPVAEQRLGRAEDYLQRTRKRTEPAVERHTRAVADQPAAHDQLRTDATIDLLDDLLPTVGAQRLHVRALSTWQRWADGRYVPERSLQTTHLVLAHQPGAEQLLTAILRDHLADAAQIREPRPACHVDLEAQRLARHDLGLEL